MIDTTEWGGEMESQMIGNLITKLRIETESNRIFISFLGGCARVTKRKRFNSDDLEPAEIAWSAIGSQDPDTTREFAKFLDKAANYAEALDYTIESKADFERVRLMPYSDKVKQQESLLIADMNGEIVIMYPGKWVE